MERLIAKSDYEVFETTLAEHQMRLTKEGWTLLRKAVIEHNLIATSKLYNNITMADLAKILEVDADGVCPIFLLLTSCMFACVYLCRLKILLPV